MPDKSDTPLTDAFLANLDMQDLELGHKYRELVKHTKFLEKHLHLFKNEAVELLKQNQEAIDLVKKAINQK